MTILLSILVLPVPVSSSVCSDSEATPQVAVIMGSDSDLPSLHPAVEILQQLGISVEVRVLSAHRTPLEMVAFAQQARTRGFKVIVAGDGGVSDHLAGDRRAGAEPCAFWR